MSESKKLTINSIILSRFMLLRGWGDFNIQKKIRSNYRQGSKLEMTKSVGGASKNFL